MHYTTDGTTPTGSSASFPTGGLTFSEATDLTVKVIAVKAGWSDSEVASKAVSVTVLETPTIIPGSNAFVISGPEGAALHYTVDGTVPTASSLTYTVEVAITETVTVKAIAVKSGSASSEVASQEVTYTEP